MGWRATGLPSTAVPEGIATDGTNIWIVDNTLNKVYKYANAAGLTGGFGPAPTSFNLHSGNTNPKDIVTGTSAGTPYLWVVNDASPDKVFRYKLDGTGMVS